MSDRSQIIRHPQVVCAEMDRIADQISFHTRKLNELQQELGQVSGIAFEMMMGTGQWEKVSWGSDEGS